MEDPQPQHPITIEEHLAPETDNTDISNHVEIATANVKAVETLESHHIKTDHTENAEGHTSSVQDDNESVGAATSEVKSKEEIEQADQQSSHSEKAEDEKAQAENDPVKAEESEDKPDASENKSEEPIQETAHQNDQSQNLEGQSVEEAENNPTKPEESNNEPQENVNQHQEIESKPEEPAQETAHQTEQSHKLEVQPDEQTKNDEVKAEGSENIAQEAESKPEEPVQEPAQQSEQSQSVEPQTIKEDQTPQEPLITVTKVVNDEPSSPSDKIKEVTEEEEVEESPGSGWRKDRGLKLNLLRIQTQAKHIENSTEDDSAAEQNSVVVPAVANDNETQEKESLKPFGSPSLRKVQSQMEISSLADSENIVEKVSRPAALKRVGSSNTGLTLGTRPETPSQPQSAATPSKSRVSMEDFQKITSVGRGSYGEVFLVKKISNNKLYALKSIDKNFMKKERKEHQVYVEREVLLKLNHPNIIKLYSSFQDKNKLYFVLEYASGGEFSDHLRIQGKLPKEQIIFFTAEIINILEYIHTCGIAHRDLKPENILLTQEGHLKCIDFGTARYLATEKRTAELFEVKNKAEETLEDTPSQIKKNHRTTFVGTAQYVSPEMLEGADTGAPADLWALGCIIYLMAVGQFAFIDMNEYLIFQKIKACTVKYPDDMDMEIKDLIQKLLVKDPNERLGAGPQGFKNDYETLKSHSLFKGIDFANLHEQKPPVVEIASPHKRKSYDFDPVTVNTLSSNNRKHFHSDDLSRVETKIGKSVDLTSDKSIRVIISGLVLKKCGWFFYKPRQLILNSKPKLVYYDPDSNQLRGEIFLAPTTKAELESKTKFTITTPTKKFTFKEMEHSAEKWVEIINTTVAQLYPKKN